MPTSAHPTHVATQLHSMCAKHHIIQFGTYTLCTRVHE
jgi:hypothetical protein